MVFYLRMIALFVSFILISIVGFFYSICRWGNLNINRDFSRVMAFFGLNILGIKVEFEGLENMKTDQPAIYIANHQSGLDMATFGPIYPPRTLVIGKRELLYIPFFGIFFKAAGNIVINRKIKEQALVGLSQAAVAVRDKKVSLWIFPEGTRNKVGTGMLPFKKGAFYLAVQTQVPITPMVSGSLGHLISWKHRRLKSGTVRIRILPPVSTVGLTEKDASGLCNRIWEEMVEVQKELSAPFGE